MLISKKLKKKIKKITSKKILRKGQVVYHVPKHEETSVLNDPNRFFKDEMEEAKKALFFK